MTKKIFVLICMAAILGFVVVACLDASSRQQTAVQNGSNGANIDDSGSNNNDEPRIVSTPSAQANLPTATVLSLTVHMGATVFADDFVFNPSLDPPVEMVTFGTEPDLMTSGVQTLEIILHCPEGRTASYEATLTVMRNEIPPTIHGTRNIEVTVGSNILLRSGVTAYDAFGRELDFTVDSGSLNLDVSGVYHVTYFVQDSCGNMATEEIRVYVLEVDIDWIYDRVDVIFRDIMRADMTQVQQARAIFDWVGANISYAAAIGRNTVYEGANQALRNRQGNCFIFFAISEVMLTRAGIENMRISRMPGTTNPTNHVWNLINPDGLGWHHFDTTPIRGNPVDRFLFTNSQAIEFTETILRLNQASNYYTFDETLYPEIVW